MLLKFKEIKKQLQIQWPMLKWCMPTDPEYFLPSKDQVQKFLEDHPQPYDYRKGLYECEEYSMGLIVDLRRYRAENYRAEKEFSYNWAVGLALTITKEDLVHYQNFAITTEKEILIIEPQTNTIKKPVQAKEVHFILI